MTGLCCQIRQDRRRLFILEHLVVLLAGPIPYTGKQYMDFVQAFKVLLDSSHIDFARLNGC